MAEKNITTVITEKLKVWQQEIVNSQTTENYYVEDGKVHRKRISRWMT